MGWSEYARSKTPLKLVFLLMAAVLVNSVIIESLRPHNTVKSID